MSAGSLVDQSAIRSNRGGEITQEQRDDIKRRVGTLPGWLTLVIMAGLFAAAFFLAGNILAKSTVLAIGAVVVIIVVTLVITSALGNLVSAGRMSGFSVEPSPGQVVWKNNHYVAESNGRVLEALSGGELQPGDYTFYVVHGTNWMLSAEPSSMARESSARLSYDELRAIVEKPIDFDPKQSPEKTAQRLAELQRVGKQISDMDPSQVSGLDIQRMTELGRSMGQQVKVLMSGQIGGPNLLPLTQAMEQAALPSMDSHGLEELRRALAESGAADPTALEANRQGRLVGSQRAALLANLRSNALVAIVVLVIGLLAAYDRFTHGDMLMTLLALAFILFLAVALALQARSALSDWANGRVQMEQAIVAKYTRTSQGSRGRSSTLYYFQANKNRITVWKSAYEALIEGRTYRVYYAPNSKKLVNIEPV